MELTTFSYPSSLTSCHLRQGKHSKFVLHYYELEILKCGWILMNTIVAMFTNTTRPAWATKKPVTTRFPKRAADQDGSAWTCGVEYHKSTKRTGSLKIRQRSVCILLLPTTIIFNNIYISQVGAPNTPHPTQFIYIHHSISNHAVINP